MLLVVASIAIAGMYIFRMNPYVKALSYTLLGDLTLADTDNNGNWDCLLQIKDFVVNIKLPIKVTGAISGFAPLPFRNINNGV